MSLIFYYHLLGRISLKKYDYSTCFIDFFDVVRQTHVPFGIRRFTSLRFNVAIIIRKEYVVTFL
jgi:hypothetical protein